MHFERHSDTDVGKNYYSVDDKYSGEEEYGNGEQYCVDEGDGDYDENRAMGDRIAKFLEWDDWVVNKTPKKQFIQHDVQTACPSDTESARLASGLDGGNKYVTVYNII